MTDTVNEQTTVAPEQVIPDMDLGELFSDAIRKAVTAQINGQAKDIASGVVADMLTPEVIAGMRETAIHETEKALNPPVPEVEPEPEPAPEPEEVEPPKPQPKYASAKEFVEDYLTQVYRREVIERGAEEKVRWCPEWWKHGEATGRFEALHRAFEAARQGENAEMSAYWLNHMDQHMDRLFDVEGPFKYCSPAKGHDPRLSALPVVPAPDGIFGTGNEFITPNGIVVPPASPGAVHRRQILDFPG
ncbi:DUF4913 domain-containing protein [Nocardia sp. IFM 10818]